MNRRTPRRSHRVALVLSCVVCALTLLRGGVAAPAAAEYDVVILNVGGVFVVKDAKLQADVNPGRAIRAPVTK